MFTQCNLFYITSSIQLVVMSEQAFKHRSRQLQTNTAIIPVLYITGQGDEAKTE